jgi:hypothetical protein
MASTYSQHEMKPTHPEKLPRQPQRASSIAEEQIAKYNGKNIPAIATDDYPRGARLTAIVTSLMLASFLVALDNVSCVSRVMYKD